jgi:hypothetical protein
LFLYSLLFSPLEAGREGKQLFLGLKEEGSSKLNDFVEKCRDIVRSSSACKKFEENFRLCEQLPKERDCCKKKQGWEFCIPVNYPCKKNEHCESGICHENNKTGSETCEEKAPGACEDQDEPCKKRIQALVDKTLALAINSAEAPLWVNTRASKRKTDTHGNMCWDSIAFFVRHALTELKPSGEENDKYDAIKKFFDANDRNGPLSESNNGGSTTHWSHSFVWKDLPPFEDCEKKYTVKIDNAEGMRNLEAGYMLSFVYDLAAGGKQVAHAMLSIGDGKAVGNKNQCIFGDMDAWADLWSTIDVSGKFEYVNGPKTKKAYGGKEGAKFTVWATKLTTLLQIMTNEVQNNGGR